MGKLVLLPLFGFSQENLVVNGNCEEYSKCPVDNSNIEDAIGFFNFSYTGSPDYLNVCSEVYSVTIPSELGFQYPVSGNGMIHDIVSKGKKPGYVTVDSLYPHTYRTESFGGSLSEALQPGIYEFSVYVNFADFGKGDPPIGSDGRVATNAFDLILMEDSIKVWRPTAPFINQFDIIPLNGETIINDTVNWIQLKTCFQAKGGERFFAIGSFRDTNEIKLEFSGYSTIYYLGLYYFDDFSLVACPTCCAGQFEVEEGVSVSYGEAQISFAPFILAGSYADLKIYDSAGRWVASHRFESDSGPFVLQHLAQGMYHYVFESQIGTVKTGKVTSF